MQKQEQTQAQREWQMATTTMTTTQKTQSKNVKMDIQTRQMKYRMQKAIPNPNPVSSVAMLAEMNDTGTQTRI